MRQETFLFSSDSQSFFTINTVYFCLNGRRPISLWRIFHFVVVPERFLCYMLLNYAIRLLKCSNDLWPMRSLHNDTRKMLHRLGVTLATFSRVKAPILLNPFVFRASLNLATNLPRPFHSTAIATSSLRTKKAAAKRIITTSSGTIFSFFALTVLL